ncbi:MAG: nucleotidyltransferase family protein [Caldilineaceae bacterium]|nr:nucleotidyltransferase family protein [Caldilineaceae bacterium]
MQKTPTSSPTHGPTRLSPELAFLLECCRPTLRAANVDAARRLLTQPPAWPRLEQMATYHGLGPLLHHHVVHHAELAAVIPATMRARLQQTARLNAARVLMLDDELCAVLHVLAAHDVPAMPYKGVALGAQFYGDAGLRVSGDIDVIVPAAQRQAAVHALQEVRGYTSLYAFHSARQEQQYMRNIHHYNLVHPTRPVMVEVHWDATGRADGFTPDWPGIWARSTAGTWQGAPVRVPSPDDLFLLLALHGSKHQWTVLKWLVDVGALLEQAPALDWSLLESRAEQWRITRSLVLTRTLSAQLLGIPAGAAVTSPLAPQVIAQIEAAQEPDMTAKVRYIMQLHERPAQRLRYIRHLLFSLNFQDLQTAQTTVPAAYVRRPWRILRKRGATFLGRLTRDVVRGTVAK